MVPLRDEVAQPDWFHWGKSFMYSFKLLECLFDCRLILLNVRENHVYLARIHGIVWQHIYFVFCISCECLRLFEKGIPKKLHSF